MKRILFLPLVAALALFASSCGKQQTEAERNAEIERQVQQRLNAEHQAEEQQKLAQRQAELDAREKALAAQQNRATPAPAGPAPARTDSAAPNESDSYATFYRKLDPYGDWMETSDYGYVFQPRQAAQTNGWRPYTNGHWVYTDAGWTWISDEPFGWATYHYGRWIRLRSIGWVWVPGEEWAPAWVSWRKSNDYVGWAPLPPEAHFDRQTGIQNWSDNYYDIGPEQYAFVPTNEFGGTLSSGVVLPTERNVTIINQTTNVTNITYNNSTVINRGPSYDDLRARSRQPIAQFRLERTQDLTNERPTIRGEVIALPAPNFRPADHPARPAGVVRTINQPTVERGWAGIRDTQAAQQTRAKMQAEATPPPNLPPKKFVRPPNAKPAAAPSAPMQTPIARATPAVTPIPSARFAPTPLPSAAPETAAEPTQPSPVEDIPTLKQADRNRREADRAGRQQKPPAAGRAQRRAEREQKMQERRDKKSGATPATPTPTPIAGTPSAEPKSPAPTATLSVSASPHPTPSVTATPENSQHEKKRPNKKGDRAPERSPEPGAQAQLNATQP